MNINISPKIHLTSQPEPSDTKPKSCILVVDDVADNRDILSRRLIRRGYDVIEACSGTEALQRIDDSDVDIVLLDIMMPDILGTEVVRIVRQSRPAWDLPIIMVSAKSQSEDVAESLGLGANDYVIKPVDFTIALARIETQLKQRANTVSEAESRREAETIAAQLRETVEEKLALLDRTNQNLKLESVHRQKTEDQLQFLAYHDSLSGLSNRYDLLEKLESILSEISQSEQDLVVIFIDLDRFKLINDVHGHEIGDQVLVEVARRLEAEMPDDLICLARLGGDEFAAVFPIELGSGRGLDIGQDIVTAVAEPIVLNGLKIQIGASAGVATSSLCGFQTSLLIKAADLAMYSAKSLGRGMVVPFEQSILDKHLERSLLEINLPGALERGEFEVHYQPLIDSETLEICSFEALLRWQLPEHGSVGPTEFIPIAEDTGLIKEIGIWVLNQACKAVQAWPDDIRVAVNVSPKQFRDISLIAAIKDAIELSGIDPKRLEIEITESCLLDAGEVTTEILSAIRDLGVIVALDDFGTGYSSISYLQQFTFDKLKIDRRFVSDTPGNPKSAAIVDAIIALSGRIGAITTVEGIENQEQMDAVVSYGCNEIQGFLFGAAMSAENALNFIQTHSTKHHD